MKRGRLIIGIDIGTAKTTIIAGEAADEGLSIIGHGAVPSKGLRKGAVISIDDAAESVREAVKAAESSAGIHIKAVHLGVGGENVETFLSHGVIALTKKEITARDIESVIDAAKAVAIPFEREILHAIPVGFSVNGHNGITDPKGMGGVRLEAKVRIVTGSSTSVQNFVKVCEKAGLEVIETILKPLAAGEALLTEDERALGAAVIDIGAGTTETAFFHEGNLCHTHVIPVGGSNFTNDIAIGLRTPAPEAEKIKIRHGCAMLSLVREEEEIEVGYAGDRPPKKVPRQYLIEIIQPRTVELFKLIKEEITGRGLHGMLSSGVVLTGGGSLMEGVDIMAENILDLPVRKGSLNDAGIETGIISGPAYSAGAGLVLYAAKEIFNEQRSIGGKGQANIISRVKAWASDIFSD
ncbi:MAG: cell division protein FtsA [Nitrospirae bacterium]|nr:cell division protein FtsA [Nitrospirota bacterium]